MVDVPPKLRTALMQFRVPTPVVLLTLPLIIGCADAPTASRVESTTVTRQSPQVVDTPAVSAAAAHADAPSAYGVSTRVEMLPVASAARLRKGLGFNVDPNQLWHIDLAKAAGASEVRMQFGWERVETSRGAYELPAPFAAALAHSVQLGLEPLVLAAYGPGWKQLPPFIVAAPARLGDTTVVVTDADGFGAITLGSAFVIKATGVQLVAGRYAAYSGALITHVNVATRRISLAAPLSAPVQAGEHLVVRNRLYAPATTDDSDPSVQAYVHYVRYLASRIAQLGSPGRVEIWNEPPWYGDRWDGGAACFYADP
ncbi:MAG TPA: hypothetical protein VGD56_04545, partial [Gemmatirosa sp.]